MAAGCAVGLLAVLFLLAAGCAVALDRQYAGTPDPAARSRGMDAVWLGHAWVDGRRGEADLAALAARLRHGGFSDIYVHAGPLADDGSLDATRAPQLGWFIRRIHALAPGIQVQAWLGNVVVEGRLDLSDRASQARTVAAAAYVIAAGADGVHYDFEPLPDGDPGLLAVLDRTRSTVTGPAAAVLSVAAEPIEPLPHMARAARAVHPQWWSAGYLREVAARVDQVALMTYDTALPTERLYGGFVARQARLALHAVLAQTHLLIGAPAYRANSLTHRDSAETVAAAIRGARLALSAHPERRLYGIAMYADFTATEQDWHDYTTLWQHPAPG